MISSRPVVTACRCWPQSEARQARRSWDCLQGSLSGTSSAPAVTEPRAWEPPGAADALERKLIARDDGHPMARAGPEAKAVRVAQCYQMERVLSCLDLGTIASEDLCSEGGHSSGRLSEAS